MLLLHVFLPLMLQRPTPNSKPKVNKKYLAERLAKWSDGKLKSLLSEGRQIQARLRKSGKKMRNETKFESFSCLMSAGKLSQAMNYVNEERSVSGVHAFSETILNDLKSKHPEPRPAEPDVMIPVDPDLIPEPVIFECITGELIQSLSRKVQGSGGPTQLDADNWKLITNASIFKPQANALCDAVAELAKKLAAEQVPAEVLHEFTASRLVALDKNPGVRPIGVGEIIRRVCSKAVLFSIRDDIQNVCGPLQTCTGIKSGVEAAIHAMREAFLKDDCEGMLLVDAENAFNSVNREVALNNVKSVCPPFFQFLKNMYQEPSKLIVQGAPSGSHLLSKEGTTQGDGAGMPMYACAIKPLVDELGTTLKSDDDSYRAIQAWFADDSACAGLLSGIKAWWDLLISLGPKYGYFPKPAKCHLILKGEDLLEQATDLFSGAGINITVTGERHLGAVIGSPDFKADYVDGKVKCWVEDVESLEKLRRMSRSLHILPMSRQCNIGGNFCNGLCLKFHTTLSHSNM